MSLQGSYEVLTLHVRFFGDEAFGQEEVMKVGSSRSDDCPSK